MFATTKLNREEAVILASKRMFAKEIVLTDMFLDMPMSARCLYFTLSMVADDDGFVDNPRAIMRQCGASLDDMRLLIAKSYVIEFETGIIVITHWRMNNYLRVDRYHPTKHTNEYSMLEVNDNKPYVLKDNSNTPNIYNTKSLDLVPNGIPSGIPGGIPKPKKVKNQQFVPPTVEEVEAYCKERNNDIDAEGFVAFYESKGWYVGKNKMKSWKSAVITWEKHQPTYGSKKISKEDAEINAKQRASYDDSTAHFFE